MNITTIHCRLIAPEPIRRHLWQLMSEKNTNLVNTLLKKVSEHPDFDTWKCQGFIPQNIVTKFCNSLKDVYPAQPARFYVSAVLMVKYTYDSWLKLQQVAQFRLEGKQKWLIIVKSDEELLTLCGATIEAIQQREREILNQLYVGQKTSSTYQQTKGKKTPNFQYKDLINRLFIAYDVTDDILSRCAIARLLKNDGRVSEAEEDRIAFNHRLHRKQKELERLKTQISDHRLPQGRNLTDTEFLKTLEIATQQIPESDAQIQEWETKLLTRSKILPYPIIYGSATDIFWGRTAQGRITVNFNGLTKYFQEIDPNIKACLKAHNEYPFQVYCDRRQLPFFQRFLEDWQIYQNHKDNYPGGLLTLSCATIVWRKGQGKGEPWNVHHLSLHCSFDTRLMTAEGTLAVQKEKFDRAIQRLSYDNPDPRNQSTLDRLKNLPNRPSQQPYRGNPDILVGISLGLTVPVTVVVVNRRTGEILTARTPRHLLGDRYFLLNRYRHRQQQNRLTRRSHQQRGVDYHSSASQLGKYLDRLLAKGIVELAQIYQADCIVIPSLKYLRDFLVSDLNAKAERKYPGSVQAQHRYVKEYRRKIHNWSYHRLVTNLSFKAGQVGIAVKIGIQPQHGDRQARAKAVAISAYTADKTNISPSSIS